MEESAKEAHDDIFLVHHDGGMELADRNDPESARAGWGAWVWQFNVYQQSDAAAIQAGKPQVNKLLSEHDTTGVLGRYGGAPGARLRATSNAGMMCGPVTTDPTDHDYVGCMAYTNNTGEMSAIPHVMAHVIDRVKEQRERQEAEWKAQKLMTTRREYTVILVYDSQYVRDMCDVADTHPLPTTNRTVIAVARQMIKAAKLQGIRVRWVKVRGHSGDRGNDKADEAATIGMKNGTRLREAHVAQSLQQAAEAEARKRREAAGIDLTGEDLPACHARPE